MTDLERLKAGIAPLASFLKEVHQQDALYNLNTMQETVEYFYETYAPFKIGDIAEFVEDSTIWKGLEGFTKKGMITVVSDVFFYERKWRVTLHFPEYDGPKYASFPASQLKLAQAEEPPKKQRKLHGFLYMTGRGDNMPPKVPAIFMVEGEYE